MELNAIATVTDIDLAYAISELSDYEISDLFLTFTGKLNNPDSIKMIANRLLDNCQKRFGPYKSRIMKISANEGTIDALVMLVKELAKEILKYNHDSVIASNALCYVERITNEAE